MNSITEKKSRRRLIFRVLLVGIILFGMAAIVFLVYRPDYSFLICEWLRRGKQEVAVEAVAESELVLEEVSLEALMSDERSSFGDTLRLINTTYLLPEDYVPVVVNYQDSDEQMQQLVLEAYERMVTAVANTFDQKLLIMDSYRTAKEQADTILEEGENTATKVGASEHQAGLALDIYFPYYAGENVLKLDAGQFVNTNCYEFGFIIRYPFDKEDVTGIRYEPWHIRYVGEPHAEIITKNALALEEYITSFEPNRFYRYGSYYVSRQPLVNHNEAHSFLIPTEYDEIVISPDGTGFYIITLKKEESR